MKPLRLRIAVVLAVVLHASPFHVSCNWLPSRVRMLRKAPPAYKCARGSAFVNSLVEFSNRLIKCFEVDHYRMFKAICVPVSSVAL